MKYRVSNLIMAGFLYLFSRFGVLSSLYYIFNTAFVFENRAVLSGRFYYYYNLHFKKSVPALLRRNIHRIEKGLIMKPRRDVFANKYIVETMECFLECVEKKIIDRNEAKWAEDVLEIYFESVQNESNNIVYSMSLFEKVKKLSIKDESEADNFSPYIYKDLEKTEVNYDEIKGLFLKRRSVRWFKKKDVPLELIEQAVDAAVFAPTACNRQPYSFHIVTTKDTAVSVAKTAVGTNGFAENIPCIIAIVGDLSAFSGERDRHLIYIDGSLVAMQLMLAMETLGLSTCPINWPDKASAEYDIRKILHLKTYERPVLLLAVGYALDDGGIAYSQKKNSTSLVKVY
ncbi:MAG: nitroreductase family protein [Methyloprofundus sp.]|nr:nitroreductase family protein [Methyloprofundus sp.]